MSTSPGVTVTGLWLGLALGAASAAEYRTVELLDGRLLTAEVLGFDETGMRVRLPQGTTTWSLSAIHSMEATTQEVYDSQPALTVLILPVASEDLDTGPLAQEAYRGLLALVPHVPGLALWDLEALQERMGAAAREELLVCGADPECVLGLLGPRAPSVVIGAELVSVTDQEDPVLRLASGYASAPRAATQVRVPYPTGTPGLDAQIMAGLYPLLHLDPDRFLLAELATYTVPGAPVVAPEAAPVSPPPEPAWRLADSEVLPWIPVPGLPSLVRGDLRGAAVAAAVVVPGTAAMVYVSGWSTWRKRQLVVAGVGSYTLLALAVNHLVLTRGRSAPAAVGVVPLEGGAAVTATVLVP